MLQHYLSLANSGDAGLWEPEEEQTIQDVRKTLAASSLDEPINSEAK
jgi:hypothetical protein